MALACLGAESVREARGGRSRRALAKSTGIQSSVISDIEDASVLPSKQQLAALAACLPGLDAGKFEEAHRFGHIPWVAAIQDALVTGGAMSAGDIAVRISNAVTGCDPGLIRWRLVRELSRLESAENFTCLASGTWSLATNPGKGPSRDSSVGSSPSRWADHQITDRYDPEHDALFHIESIPGSNEIVLNRSHPYYEPLRDILRSQDTTDLEPQEVQRRLEAAAQMMRGLLVAWAEYEDGEKAGARRERVREARQAWGRAAKRASQSGDADDHTVAT